MNMTGAACFAVVVLQLIEIEVYMWVEVNVITLVLIRTGLTPNVLM
jgi:hypothetical protein